MVSIQYTARLLNRNRKPQVRRRRRMTSATARTMKTLPAIGITQLKNQTPDGSRVAGGANCDLAKSIVASRRASEGAGSSTFRRSFYMCNLVHYIWFVTRICDGGCCWMTAQTLRHRASAAAANLTAAGELVAAVLPTLPGSGPSSAADVTTEWLTRHL